MEEVKLQEEIIGNYIILRKLGYGKNAKVKLGNKFPTNLFIEKKKVKKYKQAN